jgi:hypothetical protein
MARLVWLAAPLALAIAFQTSAASAQDRDCSLSCRKNHAFASCEQPSISAQLVSGRVIRVFRDCPNPGLILEMEIDEGDSNKLPRAIEIDIGPCTGFFGKAGDRVRVAVVEPDTGVRRYKNYCER